MLVLSRKTGESILIGNGIKVTVVSIRGDRVRLGFDAPPGVRIRRTELEADETEISTGAGSNSS